MLEPLRHHQTVGIIEGKVDEFPGRVRLESSVLLQERLEGGTSLPL